jgi:hypothetical protein
MGIIPVLICAPSPFIQYCEIPRSRDCYLPQIERKSKSENQTQNQTRNQSHSSTNSPNLLKPHDPPLPVITIITHIHRTALASTLLPLLKPALSGFSRLASPPLAKLMFALLTASLSDGGCWPEAYTINAFAVIAERTMDFVAGYLRVLPGQVVDFWAG